MLGAYSHQWWCHRGITNAEGITVCGDHLVFARPQWPGGSCTCKRQSSTHSAVSGEAYEQFFIVHALVHFGLVTMDKMQGPDQAWHQNQKLLKTKLGARDFARQDADPVPMDMNPSTPSQRVPELNTSTRTRVRRSMGVRVRVGATYEQHTALAHLRRACYQNWG